MQKRKIQNLTGTPSVRYSGGGEANTGLNVVLTFSGTPIAGDIIVCMIASSALTVVPSGFTLDYSFTAYPPIQYTYTKVADGTEGTTLTFGNANNDKKSGIGWIVKDYNGAARSVIMNESSQGINTGTGRFPSADDTQIYQPRTLILAGVSTVVEKFPTWTIRIQVGGYTPVVGGSLVQSSAPGNLFTGFSFTAVELGNAQFEITLNSGGQHSGMLYTLRN